MLKCEFELNVISYMLCSHYRIASLDAANLPNQTLPNLNPT